MIAAGAGGRFARELPAWLIRLGEIDAREGRSGEERFARAEELAAARPDLLLKVELARARRALDEGRDEDARTHIDRTYVHVSTIRSDAKQDLDRTSGEARSRGLQWMAPSDQSAVVAELALRSGDIAAAFTAAEFALLAARGHGDSALVIAALGVAGASATYQGDRADASKLFGELRAVARAARDPAAELLALTRLAELAPDLADARRLYLESMPLLEDADPEARARACTGLARCELLLGDPEQAEHVLSRIAISELKPETRIRALVLRAEVATAQGRHLAALAGYRSAWNEPRRALLPSRSQAHIGVLLGEAALRAGDAEIARDAYRRVAEIAQVLADEQLATAAREGMARVGIDTEGTGKPA
jgi:hypothetical protein